MMQSLLIANRGEIARRIIRTARRMGVRTIAVYSDADAGAPHVLEADDAVAIGPAPPRESYLVADRILAAAREAGAEAIHPGYGFLSENADFAEAVIAAGLVWVGPPPAAIRAMGLKDAAKRLMQDAGVPVTPGYLGDDQSADRLAAEAAAIGWPVLIKAVAGGGGKGMRKVEAADAFSDALQAAKREAAASFGDDRVLLEKYVTRPRHIEVQVFGDTHGQVVHLFERDCSLQRRHQKVIEEAPAPGMDEATRQALCGAAVKAAQVVGYVGAGTIEFIADASEGLRADRIWFMEMNTRLQVEHPVTEAVTGQDLVEWQLRVASGEPLPLAQEALSIAGHAIEARLYAEDPGKGFLPSTGPLTHFVLPDGVRVDSAVEEGGEVTPYYDPMIAKIIAYEPVRAAAAETLAEACRAVEVWPVRTNAAFLARCAAHPDFLAGEVDTGFIEGRLDALLAPPDTGPSPGAVASLALLEATGADGESRSPWDSWGGATGLRLNAPPRITTRVYVDASPVEALYDFDVSEPLLITEGGDAVTFVDGAAVTLSRSRLAAGGGAVEGSDGRILSPMPGKIVLLGASVGTTVKKGEALVTLEAMKMEHALIAPFDAKVAEVAVALGDQVSEGALLVKLEALA